MNIKTPNVFTGGSMIQNDTYTKISEKEFNVLYAIKKAPGLTQRMYADKTGYSLGAVNGIISSLNRKGCLSGYAISEEGLRALAPYKVDNAVIMAAGMASRFVPLSIEKPKGLLKVRGEVLIERQIRQLMEAGIKDITVVVGYLKEQFFYLEKKFGVNIVVNDDYYRYNNTSTLMLVRHLLKNTYICSSDNYFTANVFESYCYKAQYAAVFSDGFVNEYCLDLDKRNRIRSVKIGRDQSWYMCGHVFFSNDFSERFARILEEQYALPAVRNQLWEDLYLDNIKQLDMFAEKYEAGVIYEFDNLDELRVFDPSYVDNIDSAIMKNICAVLKCSASDIVRIDPIKSGMTNISFRFEVGNERYVYRHPGKGTEAFINRKAEAEAIQAASSLGIDSTFIHMDPAEGWKISRYIENARELDYHNEDDVRQAIRKLKKLHDAHIKVQNDFDVWKTAMNFVEQIRSRGRDDYEGFADLLADMTKLNSLVQQQGREYCLCHCDCFSTNFLVHGGGIELIDWEYAGNDDPALDLGVFICSCEDYTLKDVARILKLYFGRVPSGEEQRHCIAYIALASYYCFTWALYQEIRGNFTGHYLYLWQKSASTYCKKALEMYENNEE